MPQFISVDHSVCTGCRTCEVACSLHHFGECNPQRSAIRVIRKEKDGLVSSFPLVCQQCQQPSCIDACPTEALSKKNGDSPLSVDTEKCSGCGVCTDACPAGCIFVDSQKNQVIFCDLCGGQPQCVSLCHSRCLTQRSGEESGKGERIAKLAMILEAEDLRTSVQGKGRA